MHSIHKKHTSIHKRKQNIYGHVYTVEHVVLCYLCSTEDVDIIHSVLQKERFPWMERDIQNKSDK